MYFATMENQAPKIVSRYQVKWLQLEAFFGVIQSYTTDPLNLTPLYRTRKINRWVDIEQQKYVERILQGAVAGKDIYFNCAQWLVKNRLKIKGPFELVDGGERLNAVSNFLQNQITAFGFPFSAYVDALPANACFDIYITAIETPWDLYEWYLKLNDFNHPVAQEELVSVKSLRKRLLEI